MSIENRKRNKEELCIQCKLLNSFLDDLIDENKTEWLDSLEKVFDERKKIFYPEIGEKEAFNNVADLAKMSFGRNIFLEEANDHQKVSLIETLALLGYEIGDEGETGSMFGDVYERLVSYRFMNDSNTSADFVYMCLMVGNLWYKKVQDKKLQVFDDFLGKLGL